jgi:regulator of ribonuclease activity A
MTSSPGFSTADLYDANPDAVQVAEPLYRSFGGISSFWGPVATVKVFEDNSLVRQTLQEPGQGRVLLVDGGGSMQCALLGDRLAQLAIDNGWRGLVVHGCVRDSKELAQMPIGIKALAANPRRSGKRGDGERGILVFFAGVTVHDGDWLYADEDGILISSTRLEL